MKKYHVKIKPNSKKGPLVERGKDGNLTLFVREPAIDGRANKAAIELLAQYLGVAKSRVTLIKGQTSKYKVFEVE